VTQGCSERGDATLLKLESTLRSHHPDPYRGLCGASLLAEEPVAKNTAV